MVGRCLRDRSDVATSARGLARETAMDAAAVIGQAPGGVIVAQILSIDIWFI